MVESRVTVQYPEEKRTKPQRFHGRHVLNRYEDGMEKCIGCELCAGVCPAKCIYVRGRDNPVDAPVSPGERYGFVYEINYLRCIHCDLCVEACPTEAITESKLFEFSFSNREDAIYTRDELVVDDDGRPRQQPWEDWREGDDESTSAWMRATAPSGDAGYLGKVQWAGELVGVFLFVIMLIGDDREEDVRADPLRGQRPAAFALGALGLAELLGLARFHHWVTGAPSAAGAASGPGSNVEKLARSVFTRYLLPFEVTSVLLVIAVVGAVVLARRPSRSAAPEERRQEEAASP